MSWKLVQIVERQKANGSDNSSEVPELCVYVETDSETLAGIAGQVKGVGAVEASSQPETGKMRRMLIRPARGTSAEELSMALKAKLWEADPE